MKNKKSPISLRSNEKYFTVFLLGFFSLLILMIPIMIYTGGYYTYYGDYNSQQIPFYNLAHKFIREEGLGWNWNTDLGANFVGSYSFYLLGSPFFWITLIFPNNWVTFLMPFLLCLKHGVAAVTSYAYIRRFVKNKNAALIGSLLYAYSGFQMFNLFFNHFQDVTALFPLLLIALEERVNNERRGVFVLAVAMMAIVNYFFFTGQVVFVIIYLLLRLKSPDFKITWRKFLGIALESVIGVMIAAVLLLPSALAILGNYRINERLYGLDLVTYNDRTRIIRIIQSFFMIPDVPARPNLFSTNGGKWSSIGGYLPMFSMAGVIAYSKAHKKHWSVKLVVICMIMGFIPILNSMFYMLNSSYYARWFYMPILIMAMMTAKALDDKDTDLMPGIKVCAVILGAFAVISFLPTKDKEDKIHWLEFANYPAFFAITAIITAVGLAVLFGINHKRKKGKSFMKTAVVSTAAACVICTGSVIYFGVSLGPYPDTYINNGINGRENISLPKEENQFYRIDISENYDNYPMFWGYSSMRAFQSIVPGSIMEFYNGLGITRDVASRVPLEDYTMRGLFSVKYYFDKVYDDEKEDYTYSIDLPGFEYIDTQNEFYIYENKYYIPEGFTYDYYIDAKKAESYSNDTRKKLLIRSLALSEEQIEKYSGIIEKLPFDMTHELDEQTYISDCMDRQRETCSSFIYDSDGFKAEISLEKDNLVFFSVPYDDGWTAYVNGKPADVEKVNYGFMAVKASAGENKIEFRYETPGLRTGALISIVGIILLAAYIIIFRIRKSERKTAQFSHYYDYNAESCCNIQKQYERRLTEEHHRNREEK